MLDSEECLSCGNELEEYEEEYCEGCQEGIESNEDQEEERTCQHCGAELEKHEENYCDLCEVYIGNFPEIFQYFFG